MCGFWNPARRHHDVVRFEAPVARAGDVAAVLLREGVDADSASYRQFRTRCVGLEVVGISLALGYEARRAGNASPDPSRLAGE